MWAEFIRLLVWLKPTGHLCELLGAVILVLSWACFLLLLVPSGHVLHILFVVFFGFFLPLDLAHFGELGVVNFDLTLGREAVSVEVRSPVELPVVNRVSQLGRDVLHVSIHFANELDPIHLLLLQVLLKPLHVLWVCPRLAAFDLRQEALMVWRRWRLMYLKATFIIACLREELFLLGPYERERLVVIPMDSIPLLLYLLPVFIADRVFHRMQRVLNRAIIVSRGDVIQNLFLDSHSHIVI